MVHRLARAADGPLRFLFTANTFVQDVPFILPIDTSASQGVRSTTPTMNSRTRLQHLGERQFLDYPVFLEAGLAERSDLLGRALIAALGVACVVLAAAAVFA